MRPPSIARSSLDSAERALNLSSHQPDAEGGSHAPSAAARRIVVVLQADVLALRSLVTDDQSGDDFDGDEAVFLTGG
jgi:hypothetical protein